MTDLPDAVAELLRDRLASLDQLQVLLLLSDHEQREWTSEMVAEALKMPLSIVIEALSHLSARDLFAERFVGATPTFMFAPRSAELAEAVAMLAQTFRKEPLGVMKIMNEHALERVRARAVHTFADAFLLHRKRGKDG